MKLPTLALTTLLGVLTSPSTLSRPLHISDLTPREIWNLKLCILFESGQVTLGRGQRPLSVMEKSHEWYVITDVILNRTPIGHKFHGIDNNLSSQVLNPKEFNWAANRRNIYPYNSAIPNSKQFLWDAIDILLIDTYDDDVKKGLYKPTNNLFYLHYRNRIYPSATYAQHEVKRCKLLHKCKPSHSLSHYR